MSTAIVLWTRWRSGRDGEQAPPARAPWRYLVVIGLLNGFSNFLMAIAQPHTAGLTQSMLGTLGVPLVMALSFVVLRKRPAWLAVVGAALIVAGAAMSGMRAGRLQLVLVVAPL